ncbi:hypothetical protein J7E29_07980 [Streptomyces sp. ISL-90]|nr:hypothetical protein [Streptomyces sp. ISL-90]
MRKVMLASVASVALLIGAVFMGVAAATTGAPIREDARYVQPPPGGPDRFGVVEGDDGGAAPGAPAPVDEAGSDANTPPSPAPAPEPTPAPAPTPEPTPTPTPEPTPTPTPTPGPDGAPSPDATPDATAAPTAAEQEAWRAFQQVVRDCMAEAGQGYVMWEWWNNDPSAGTHPGMPAGLTDAQAAAWELALDGNTGTGADYRWEDAGCWGYAVHVAAGAS